MKNKKYKCVAREGCIERIRNIILTIILVFAIGILVNVCRINISKYLYLNEVYNTKHFLQNIEHIKILNICDSSIKNKKKTEYHTKELNKKEEIRKREEEKQRQQAIAQTTPLNQHVQNEGVLNRSCGVFYGPNGKETYYNLNMSGVIAIMRGMGNNDEYWIREDGVKMLGDYIMVACHLGLRPRGSLIETSLGTGIVCDTGGFAQSNPTQIDIAVNW